MTLVAITHDPIDIAALAAHAGGPENGAVLTFVGQTRRLSRGREVEYLEYTAHEPMALTLIRRIAEEAESRWSCRAAIAHRLGRVGLEEASVVIAVGSAHRGDAFEACRWCIDTLKETVPIWKKEVCPDGTFWIEGDQSVPGVPAPP